MIVCPKCGSPTSVRETRASSNYFRRRRICNDADCNGRVTTLEVAVSKKHHAGDVVIVAKADLELIAGLASGAAGRLVALSIPRVDLAEEPDDTDDNG